MNDPFDVRIDEWMAPDLRQFYELVTPSFFTQKMMTGLRLSTFEEQLNERFSDAILRLKASGVNSEVAMANSLWAQQDDALRSEFLDLAFGVMQAS